VRSGIYHRLSGRQPVDRWFTKDAGNAAWLPLNPLLGQTLTLQYTGAIYCVACGRKTSKSFNQGHCFPCVRKLASCDICIVKPELCHYDKGTCREPQWGESWCMDRHYVYLANTSGLKVGITHDRNLPSRWIDQGATQALPVYRVASRFIAGLLEKSAAEHIADKTNWRKMLQLTPEPIDLLHARETQRSQVAEQFAELNDRFGEQAIEALPEQSAINIDYPVLERPVKIKSHNLDKQATVTGTLMGIIAQYLVLDTGVINIRKFSGYEVELKA